jgi:glycosyltransferase involved in cell wall biosynthesis
MRIALITETFLPQVNGVVRTLEKIIQHLENSGHETMVITIGEGENFYSKTEVVRVPGVKFSLYKELHLVKPQEEWFNALLENEFTQVPIAMLQALLPRPHPMVEEALNRFNPDLVHLVTPVTLGSIGYYYADNMKLPCLATFHTDIAAYAPLYQQKIPYIAEMANTITKLVYDKADRVLAPSPSSQKQLETLGLNNVGVFGRGVNCELFNPARRNRSVLERYGLSRDLLTILYAGRLAEEKSIPILIQDFKDLSQIHDIQLLLVGDGPLRSKIEEDLKGTKYAFTGMKKDEEYAELHASCDIFAFPSKTETFGQVVLEAMASGLAVVGFDAPGVRDLVKHKFTGLLVDSNPGTSLKTVIETLIKDSDLRHSCSVAARMEAQSRSWTEILNTLLGEYEALINSSIHNSSPSDRIDLLL